MPRLCYVIGAGDTEGLCINSGDALVIAADGGFNKMGDINPDIIVGDFDSLGFVPEWDNTVKLPVEKDVTDMAYAISLGEKKGCDTFIIFGGMGGRPDHTLANIALLADLAKRGKRGYLLGEGFVTTAITDTKLSVLGKKGDTISVFAFGSRAEKVTLKGLKYPLEGYTLESNIPLGVSNSFEDNNAIVSVENGTLVVMWQEQRYKDFIDNIPL